jgi:hypothetical protein
VSDTHGLVRPEMLAALAGVRHILHAGDVGTPDVLDALAAIAPVTAVRGNNDHGAWAERLPHAATVELGGVRLHVVHEAAHVGTPPDGTRAVVTGHSHRPLVAERDGVLWLNPGSAGPRRFRLPVAVARLAVGRGRVAAEIVTLAV